MFDGDTLQHKFFCPERNFDMQRTLSGDEAVMLTLFPEWVIPGNGLHRKKLWDMRSTFNAGINHINVDEYDTREMFLNANFIVLEDVIYHYRLHSSSESRKICSRWFEFVITDKMVENLLHNHFGKDSQQALIVSQWRINNLIGYYKMFFRSKLSYQERKESKKLLKEHFATIDKRFLPRSGIKRLIFNSFILFKWYIFYCIYVKKIIRMFKNKMFYWGKKSLYKVIRIYLQFLYFFLRMVSKISLLSGCVIKIKIPKIKYPIFLRLGTTDIIVFREVFMDDEYHTSFKNPNIIFDGGSYIGLYAIVMKNKYPNAKIVCIEPDPENFEILKKNVLPYDHIYVEKCGLWDKDTNLKVIDKYNCGKWGIIVEEDLINGTIPATSINSLLKKYSCEHIDILKLNIEGSEKQLFSKNYTSWLSKVNYIVIELHDGIQSGCSKTFFEAINHVFLNYTFSITGYCSVIISNVSTIQDLKISD